MGRLMWYQVFMVASKGLTKKLHLRMTDDERQLIDTVQQVYKGHGVEMSLNDTIRHLVRRAAIVPACTIDGAREQINDHVKECGLCADSPSGESGCPEGVYLHRNYRRVIRAYGGTTGTDAL